MQKKVSLNTKKKKNVQYFLSFIKLVICMSKYVEGLVHVCTCYGCHQLQHMCPSLKILMKNILNNRTQQGNSNRFQISESNSMTIFLLLFCSFDQNQCSIFTLSEPHKMVQTTISSVTYYNTFRALALQERNQVSLRHVRFAYKQ